MQMYPPPAARLRSLGPGALRQDTKQGEHRVRCGEDFWGLQADVSVSPVQHLSIQALTRQFCIHQRPRRGAGLGLFTAKHSSWELSNEYISAMKKMIAFAFMSIIRLNIHHKTGVSCEPGTESMQAALDYF